MTAKMMDREDEEGHCLELSTLGKFEVKSGEVFISEKAKHSNKLWELFKYFLTYRGYYLSPETIIDSLWPEEDYVNPKSALHNLLHRLRKIFNQNVFAAKPPFYIDCREGNYYFQLNSNCWFDVDEFLKLSQKASRLALHNPEAAIGTYYSAISLYKGEYLPGYYHKKWLIPVREYYRRIYLQNILELIELLKDKRRYLDIQTLCEKVFHINLFVGEEKLHKSFMEALAEQGKIGDAISHYEFITKVLYKDLGANPPFSLKNYYKKIKADREDVEPGFNYVEENLKKEGSRTRGAFFCDKDFFRMLYELEERRSRMNSNYLVCWCMFTLTDKDYSQDNIFKKAGEHLKSVLILHLRTGDVLCQWNHSQFTVLLPSVNYENAQKLLHRIEREFYKEYRNGEINLKGEIKILPPSQDDEG